MTPRRNSKAADAIDPARGGINPALPAQEDADREDQPHRHQDDRADQKDAEARQDMVGRDVDVGVPNRDITNSYAMRTNRRSAFQVNNTRAVRT